MPGPTPDFWQERFENRETGWDRGGPSPQLLAWVDGGELRPCRIAVPGCGSGWEVAWLAQRGFEVVGIDYTPAAVERTRARCAAQGVAAEVIHADVLGYRPAVAFDAVYEQTCLCALHPEHWGRYAQQLQAWLRPEGGLWAMFLQVLRPAAVEEGQIQGPPFHCDINGMRALFPEATWIWPEAPLRKLMHPSGVHELAARLQLRAGAAAGADGGAMPPVQG